MAIERLSQVDLLRRRFDSWNVGCVGVDFDGTLIDTPGLFRQAMHEVSGILSASMRGYGPGEIYDLMSEVMRELRPEFGVWPSIMDAAVMSVAKVLRLGNKDPLVENALKRVRAIYEEDTPLIFAGARRAVDCIRATGRDVYLMTHADPDWTRHKLDVTRLGSYFARIVCFSIDESKAGQWERVLCDLGIEPERFLVIGDNKKEDIIPPLSLGAWGVWVCSDSTSCGARSGKNLPWHTGRVLVARGIGDVVNTLVSAG